MKRFVIVFVFIIGLMFSSTTVKAETLILR